VKDFSVSRLTATENQLDMWNLHALQTSANLKMKNKDKSVPLVEKLDATGIDLDFTTEQKRERFENHFKFVSNARNNQVQQFKAGRRVAASQAHKPTRRQSYAPTGFHQDFVQADSATTIRGIRPPVLSDFQDSR
jgi:membrane-bound lytic murein transglycosylase